MSVAVSSWVWNHSRSRGNARLVLLAIADCADDSGANAWPSLASIASKVAVSRSTAIRAVETLVDLGELQRHHAGGRRGRGGVSNGYRVIMDDAGTSSSVTPPCARSGVTDGTSSSLELVANPARSGVKSARSGVTVDTRTSLEQLPTSYADSDESVTPKPSARKKRRTPAPDAMEVTTAMAEWAEAKGVKVELEAETERFLDFHRAKGNAMVDWRAAWRTWMANTKRWGSPHAQPTESSLAPLDRGVW